MDDGGVVSGIVRKERLALAARRGPRPAPADTVAHITALLSQGGGFSPDLARVHPDMLLRLVVSAGLAAEAALFLEDGADPDAVGDGGPSARCAAHEIARDTGPWGAKGRACLAAIEARDLALAAAAPEERKGPKRGRL